ncbi:hypothetical protein [Mesorhizobium erdmanii]|uniref:Uncharacterized protein n=1 Tax=Mesorhizobium erdmanii TaxID=1777866 RepID=A0A6M7UKJ9_9HYPH|nr:MULTISPECIES: hypothetical protein [Mesorhizobium]OBQ74516.1 hypothetical protein A8146_01785 [Mesorhizobium loti]QKC76673.1 hypothetical protein EB233_15115 [Mesorhizobium erdmanii]
MTHRYATIITDDDGHEIVSAIGAFEGPAPQARLGRIEQVALGVLIGMVRDAGGGFGFPQAGIAGRAVGLVVARLRAQTAAAKPGRPAGAAQSRATKRTRKVKKKAARAKKPVRPAKAPVSAGDVAAPGHVHD